MTYDEFTNLMHTECDRCGTAAQLHRLTPSGRFYCLQFNYTNRWRKDSMTGTDKHFFTMRCKVNELIRSPLPQSIGKLINGELRGHPVNVGEQLAL